ncbi:hypothetical protein [Haloferula sp.]|uniref:hypothetical protein n=1 Tax=Haloferula sp. TaxID=2497595 RepID=UPI00329B35AD
MDSESQTDGEILEGADLCIGCLYPVRPGSQLCVKCGAPHGELAGFLPLTRVLAEGYVYRQAVQNPRSWISVAGIWMLFGVHVIGGFAVTLLMQGPIGWYWGQIIVLLGFIVGPVALALFALFGIVQSTCNYLMRGRRRYWDEAQ